MEQPLRRIKHATGAAAIAISVTKNYPFFVKEIRLTLGSAATDLGDLEIHIDSELGSDYDHTICTPDPNEDLTSVTSFRYADQVPPVIFPGDALKIAWPNTGTKTWAIEIIAQD